MSDKPLVYVSHSLANNFKDRIEMNVYLKDYPELHDSILEHELQHTDSAFTKKDLLLDLTGSKINYLKLLSFMLSHPRSFYQLSPIVITKEKKIIYDVNQIIIYLVLFGVISTSIYFALRL